MKTIPLGQNPPLDLVAALEKARTRMGLGPWNRMAWFVKLANTKVEAWSSGDIQNLQEECAVIRREPLFLSPAQADRKRYLRTGGGMGSASPTLLDLKNIHEAIAPRLRHLADLTDAADDVVTFGLVALNRTIQFRKTNEAQRQAGWAPHVISETVDVTGGSWPNEFLLRAAQLLETFVDSIRRCPRPGCEMIFVQPRKNAVYCSRSCQNKHYMQTVRASPKKRSAATHPQKSTAKAKKGK